MSAQDPLAELPEPIQQALVDLVAAIAGLGQVEKLTAVAAFHKGPTGPGAYIAPVLSALGNVVDELHTAATPVDAQKQLALVKSAQRGALQLLRECAGLAEGLSEEARRG